MDQFPHNSSSLTSVNNIEESMVKREEKGKEELATVDDFLDTIGLSRYHYIFFLACALIMMHEGSQLVIVSIVNVIYTNDPSQNQTLVTLFGSSLFIGNLIGSISGGYLSDKVGRKIPLGVTLAFMYVSALMQYFFDKLSILIFFRGCYGIGMGLFGSIAFPYMAEIMPRKYRGLFLTLFGGVWTIGGIITVCVALFLNPTLKLVNWQLLTLIVNQSALLSIVIVFFYLVESPRYSLMVSKDFEGCKSQLQAMAKKSGRRKAMVLIDDDLFDSLREWADSFVANENKSASYLDLFNSKYLKRTLAFVISMFFLNFNYYGSAYITPKVYEDENNNSQTVSLLYPNLMELIAGIGSALCIELSFFGRKKSVYLGGILGAVSGGITAIFLSFNDVGVFFLIFSSATRLASDFALIILECFISESYGVSVRGMGVGFSLTIGKIASALMPFILNAELDKSPSLTFITFAILNAAAIVAVAFTPKETRGEKLDD